MGLDRDISPPNALTPTSRVRDLARVNPLEFCDSKVDEDPKEFIDEVYKVVDIIGVTLEEKAELAAYKLKGITQVWYTQWKSERVEGLIGWVSYSKGQGGGVNASGTTLPKFTKYGRNHGGKCLIGMGACFGCGKMGHKIPKCPNKGREGRPQGQATQGGQAQQGDGQRQNRFYALHATQDVDETLDVVMGLYF
ncbi:uncharacterized protein LOC129894036 [Solanum dulcamara]|uniref:uncharacterized protein LOC129894036 n=1 Tax=Solanum dulcamara TaxID=45834 RepID=UPI002485D90E|nr:uncharacterized protein LOC129894036 [Solanum dulcamara]